MTPETLASFRAHALEAYPDESCALAVVVKGRERYVRCKNIAPDPRKTWVISGEEYAAVADAGEIIAVMHSHPDEAAVASQADRVQCEHSAHPWYIVGVLRDPADDSLTLTPINSIVPEGYEAPLIGREFFHGTLDCYTLIQDWYARERGITLPDFEHPDDWWDDGHSALYLEHFRDAGFEPCDGPLREGDVILMTIRSGNGTPNHAGVYVGEGLMLHHLMGRLSSRDPYGGYYAEVTQLVVRYAR